MVARKKTNKTDTVIRITRSEKAAILKKAATEKIRGADIVGASKSHVGRFFDFIREQGVIGLAVGLALGTAAGASVKQIVDGLISPIVGFLIGGIDLAQLKWVAVGAGANGKGGLVFSWGAVISSLITLIVTALVIYWLVRVTRLDRIDKKKED